MSNIKKVDKCAKPASTSASSQIRPTRKRQRGVLIERNDSDNDSDFIDEKEDVYKNSKQNRTATTSSKTTKSVTKTSKGTSTKRSAIKNASSTSSSNESLIDEKKNETQTYDLKFSTDGAHFHRRGHTQHFSRGQNNNSFFSIFSGLQSGLVDRDKYYQSAVRPIIDNVTSFRVSQLVTPFDRRVTALAWHPQYPHLAAAGSKGGDIILWDSARADSSDRTSEGRRTFFKSMIEGRGPGGSIQSLKFDINHPDKVYTASIDGTVTRHDFQGKDNKIYLETNDWERWYVGMDISFSGKMMVAGNNKGIVSLLSLEGERIWDLKLHKAKCNFVQFSEREPWMMVTTSTGGGSGAGCKVWDIRNIKGPESAITELPHNKAVNSAYFSKVTGDKLLTTDQHSELRFVCNMR